MYERFFLFFRSLNHSFHYIYREIREGIKDLFWNMLLPVPWCLAFFFTFAVGIDFILIAYKKRNWINFFHYLAQGFWVLANFAWGMGEQFNSKYDDPISITQHNRMAATTGRWWAQVLLIIAWIPIVVMYFIYLPHRYFQHEKQNVINAASSSNINACQFKDQMIATIENPMRKDDTECAHK